MQAMHKQTSKTVHVHRQTATLCCTSLPRMHALVGLCFHVQVQRPFLGGKLEMTQTVPGGRWFLVPTPAFKVRPCDPRLCYTLPRPRARR